jgi:BioD-like phosphotransacetylase family protein
VIINKINDEDNFENTCVPVIKEMGIDILGVIPYKEQLTYFTVEFLAEKLMARVLAGEEKLKNIVQNIIIGAMSTADPNKNPLFARPSLNRENQLMITAGDRSDMILAALERDTIGIILTNDIVPPQLIIARAKERGIPLLLVGTDTFKTAKMIDDMEALLTKDDADKINLLSQLVTKYTKMKEFLK